MKAEILKIETPELALIEKSKAEQIRNTFEPMYLMLKEFEDRFNELNSIPLSEITPEICAKFKRFRLDVAKVRIETGKVKDKSKEDLKLLDKAIMGVHNILVYAVKAMEDVSKEKELYFENLEKQRFEELQKQRFEKISNYVEADYDRDLSKLEEDEFDALLLLKKSQFETKKEEERLLEEERLRKQKEEEEERERIRIENERLRAEAKKREKEIEAERKKQAEILAKIKAEETARKKAEEEAKKIAEETARKKAEEEARIKAENEAKAKAPIKEQMYNWVNSFAIDIFEKENEKSKLITEKFNAFKNWAKKEIENL